jgi:hypothetical protein
VLYSPASFTTAAAAPLTLMLQQFCFSGVLFPVRVSPLCLRVRQPSRRATTTRLDAHPCDLVVSRTHVVWTANDDGAPSLAPPTKRRRLFDERGAEKTFFETLSGSRLLVCVRAALA